MTDEEYFRKNNPDFCYGERPLSPYWDLFQDGVEFGERQSEQKIEELENKKAGLEERCEISQDEVSRLIQENTELKKINSETLTQLNLDNGELIIENEKLRKENEELRNNGFTVSAMTEQQLKVAIEKGERLEKENAEWEKFVKDIQNRNEENYLKVCHKLATELNRGIKLTEQLAKAIELLAKWVELYKPKSKTVLPTPIQVATEKFLKEIEK